MRTTRSASRREAIAEAAAHNALLIILDADVCETVIAKVEINHLLAPALTCVRMRATVADYLTRRGFSVPANLSGYVRAHSACTVSRLTWMQALGIPMDATIAVKAAGAGDLPLLQHAVLSLGCGWAEERTWPKRPHHNSRTVDVLHSSSCGASACNQVGTRQRRSVGRADVRSRRSSWPACHSALRAQESLPVGLVHRTMNRA